MPSGSGYSPTVPPPGCAGRHGSATGQRLGPRSPPFESRGRVTSLAVLKERQRSRRADGCRGGGRTSGPSGYQWSSRPRGPFARDVNPRRVCVRCRRLPAPGCRPAPPAGPIPAGGATHIPGPPPAITAYSQCTLRLGGTRPSGVQPDPGRPRLSHLRSPAMSDDDRMAGHEKPFVV